MAKRTPRSQANDATSELTQPAKKTRPSPRQSRTAPSETEAIVTPPSHEPPVAAESIAPGAPEEPEKMASPETDERYAAVDAGPSEDEIRHRAYQRYLERGGGPGSEFDDWLHAEQELRKRK